MGSRRRVAVTNTATILPEQTCYTLGIGDVLEVQTGNMVGPTLQGVERNGNEQYYVCYTLTSNGDCLNQDGTTGVDIKAAFHLCYQRL